MEARRESTRPGGDDHLLEHCCQPGGRLRLEGLGEPGPDSPELWGTYRRPGISRGGTHHGRDSKERERGPGWRGPGGAAIALESLCLGLLHATCDGFTL